MQIYGAKKGSKSNQKPNIQKDTTASTSYINALYGLSEGEVQGLVDGGKSIKLDGTPLINANGQPNFENVSWEFRSGTVDQEAIKGFAAVENEQSIGIELRHDRHFTRTISNNQLSALSIRLGWGALREQKQNGDIVGYRIEYAVDVQTDGGAYQEMLRTFIHDKASQGYQRSHRIELPKAKRGWTLRVRRLTPNRDSELIGDSMSVVAITEIIDVPARYPCTALVGVRYDAETFGNIAKISVLMRGMIVKVPSNYNAQTRTYTGIWDGAFIPAYTNNPAWVFYDICTAKRYGLGDRLAGKVDKWSLYRLAQYCDEMVDDGQGGKEPRFTCNVYLQQADDAYKVLQSLSSIFRAMSYWDGTQIIVDADVPKDTVYTFSNANVVGGSFVYTGARKRDRHTICKVAFGDPDNEFKTDYVHVRNEYAIAKYGISVLEINAFGCTSRSQAYRTGAWALQSEQLETETVSFSAGLDGFVPSVGEVIDVLDNTRAGQGAAGRIISAHNRVITLDRMAGKIGDTLVINGKEGNAQTAKITKVAGVELTLDKTLDADAGAIWAVTSHDLAPRKFRVMSITQNEDQTFAITGLQYEPSKFSAADNGVQAIQTPVSVIKPGILDAPSNVIITSHNREHQGQSITTLSINWAQVKGAVAYIVEWRKDDNAWQVSKIASQSLDIDGVYSGNYLARVKAVDAFDNESDYGVSALTQITGKQGKPPRLASLNVQGILFGMELGWVFNAGSGDTNYTEIEVSPDGRSNIATLGTFAYPTNKHEITGLQGNLTQFYRARIVDKLGNTSDWTDWASGTTSADAEKVLDILSGQISQSHLDQSLRTPIGKIGTIESNISGINRKIPTIESNINSFNSKIPSINKIPTIESNINSVNSKIPTIESNISGISSRADTINSTLNDANNRLNEAVQSITNIDTRTQWQTRGATSLNSLTEQGKYYLESVSNTNTPLTGWQYATVDKARNGDRITQTVWNDRTKTYTRTKTGDVWSDWVESVDKTQLDNTANQLTQSIEQTSTQIRATLATKASTDSVTGAIRDINALQADKNAKTQEIANLTQTVNGHTSQVRQLGVTTGDLTQKYSQLKTTSDTANSEITAIKQTQIGQASSVERLRSEMADKASSADLQSVQQTLATADSSLSQSINTLQSDYNGNKASVQSSINTLTDANRTQSERLERLTTRFDGVLGGQNLLSDTTTKTGTQFLLGEYPINRTLQEGQRVIVKATTTPAQQVLVYNSSPRGANRIGEITADGTPHEFTWAVGDGGNNSLHIYRTNINNRSSVTLDAVSLAVPDGALADVTANLAEFKQVTADKDQATASRITSIDTAYKQADSTLTTQIASEITARTDADNSLASRINTLQSDYNGNKASVAGQLKTLSDKDNATASQISRLNSQMADKASSAALNSLTTKVNQADGKITAQTQRLNTLQSSVSGQTASIRNVERSVNGVRAIKAVTVDNNGFISGYGLMSDLQNGRVTSRFGINADQIYFGTTTNAKKPFVFTTRATTIDGVSYPAGAWINSASIARASINMLHIADSIQSDNYVAGRQGWRLFKDGRFELNNTFGDGSSLELNSQGLTVWYDKAQGKKAVELGILL